MQCVAMLIRLTREWSIMSTSAPQRSPWTFFALVVVLSIPFLAVGALTDLTLPLGLPFAALAFVCPLLAASILTYREEGRSGPRRLLRNLIDHRALRPRKWYAPIILLMPAIYLLSYSIMLLMGLPVPDLLPVLFIPLLFIIFFFAAAGEEAGWTGYALDPLQAKWGALGAALIIGAVWAGWHVLPDLQAHQPWEFVAGQRSFTVLLRVLMVWIYNNAGKSVLSAILVHDLANVSFYALFPEVGYFVPAITAAIAAVAVLIVVLLWGPRTLARYRFGRASVRKE